MKDDMVKLSERDPEVAGHTSLRVAFITTYSYTQ